MQKIVRITTVPLSLEKLLEGQLTFMNNYYEVIAVSADKERLEKFGKENEVKTFWVNMTRSITPISDLRAVFKLYRFFKKEKPLLVHTHTPKAGIVGMMAAKMAGVPLRLHTVAGLPLLESSGLKRQILEKVEATTYRFATAVYPNSAGLRDIILAKKFTHPKKVKVLGKGSSNGIDTHYFDPEKYSEEDKRKFRAELNIPAEDIVFVFVGRLVSDKGINELVAAFERLNRKNKATSLLLVGPFEEELDPLKPSVVKIIEPHPKIYLTGFKVDVRPYLAISDVLAFPSYREGFPNVVMQAGAMNLPSIVTDINGCNELISEGVNGLIIPVKDEQSLFEAMDLVTEDRELRKALAGNSRKEIRKFYERKEFWELLLKEYRFLEQVHFNAHKH